MCVGSLGWHVNAWQGSAKASVERSPTHLKLLNTALDLGVVAAWRQRNPTGLLVYREVFESGYPGEDAEGRCDRLSQHAEPLLPHGVIVETPWNEELQADSLLPLYSDLTCRAIGILRSRGFGQLAVGHFSVQWPQTTGRHLYLPAVRLADYYSRHAYSADSLAADWQHNIGAAAEDCAWMYQQTGKPSLITEFGLDRGVLGSQYAMQGWRSVSNLSVASYAGQIRDTVSRLPACIKAVYLYCCGQFGDWWSFDTAGEWAIESLLREETHVPNVGQGFQKAADLVKFSEDEIYHALDKPEKTSLAIGTAGYATWRAKTNQTVVATDDGRILTDFGNASKDGGKLHQVYPLG